jgi:tetratricopeptide (TPR) repeat protein
MDAFYVFNIGEIALDQGHLETAERNFEDVSRTWRAAGYRSGAADANCKLGRLAAVQGRYQDAIRLFEESIGEFRDVGSQADALEAQARMAECLVLSGELSSALASADEALEQARALGGVPPQIPLVQRVRGAALARLGDTDRAREALEQSLQAARSRSAEYEMALTMRLMATFGFDSGDDSVGRLQQSAADTLAKLGVVWSPDLSGDRRPPGVERRSSVRASGPSAP